MKSFGGCRLLIAAAALFLGVARVSAADARSTFDLKAEVERALKAGGGEVVVPPGEHVLPDGLFLKEVKNLQIVGFDRDSCILKLPPVAYALAGRAAEKGAMQIDCQTAQGIAAGMLLQIEADGEIEPFTKKSKPFFTAKVKAVDGKVLLLDAPLSFPLSAGVMIRDHHGANLIELQGACEKVELRKLTLDGGRVGEGPEIRGHAQLCGVMVAGRYTYEKGPQGPQPKNIKISDCIVRNCYGRGVAFYSVTNAVIENCTIMATNDEAVDLDHFSTGCVVQNNYIARSLVGVELNDATSCRVEANEVRNCGTGINLWRWCKQPGLNEGNTIARNLFEDCAGNAIQIGKQTAKNQLLENEIVRAGRNGISLFGDDQTVHSNKIEGAKLLPIAVGEGSHSIK